MKTPWVVAACIGLFAAAGFYQLNRRLLEQNSRLIYENEAMAEQIEAWEPLVREYASELERRGRTAVNN